MDSEGHVDENTDLHPELPRRDTLDDGELEPQGLSAGQTRADGRKPQADPGHSNQSVLEDYVRGAGTTSPAS